MGRTYSTYGKRRGSQKVSVGKPEEKRPLGRLRRRWEDLLETGLGDIDWFDLAQDRDR